MIMGKLVILITLPIEANHLQPLKAAAPEAEIIVHPARTAQEVPPTLWERAEILYTWSALPDPEAAPNLKWVQFHLAGIDHVADHPLIRSGKVAVTTMSGAAVPQMGEYVLMMLLALGHRLPALMDSQRRKAWPEDRWQRFMPVELNTSTVGIVGYGSLGREVARLLRAFGATVLATKRDVKHPKDHGYIPAGHGDPQGAFVRRLYPPQALRSMARECDFLVVTVPLTPETRGMVNAEVFAALKPGAFLVDISRGGVVDHEALIAALESGQLAGAALDVFPQEPLPPESPLWEMPNVILSPHIAGNTPHYHARAMKLFAANLSRYLKGQPLFNRYHPERGY